MSMRAAAIIAIGLVAAAACHAILPIYLQPTAKPLLTGYIQGEIAVEKAEGIAHHKCDGCRIECFESFVVVYIDKEKEPTWTDDYVMPIPWERIEYMMLKPPSESAR